MNDTEHKQVELLGIYNIMGEGLVVELLEDDKAALYDKQIGRASCRERV